MGFPPPDEVKRILKKLENAEPTYSLPENPTKAEVLKYELCRRFVIYLRKHKITQKALAEQLDMDPARMSEVVRYRIDLFTTDKLLDYSERLDPNVEVIVK